MSDLLKIKQLKSSNGLDVKQLATLRSLKLNKIGAVVEKSDTPQLRGMLHALRHIVEVEKV